jgi:hypothetical protein
MMWMADEDVKECGCSNDLMWWLSWCARYPIGFVYF